MVSDATREKRASRSHLKTFAKNMRREPTLAEVRFWHQVRDRRLAGLKFRRQVPIGRYIADFVCSERMLIVEIDGGQHADSEKDAVRDAYLTSQGYQVLRFWNNDVLASMESVMDTLLAALAVPPHPVLSPAGGEGN